MLTVLGPPVRTCGANRRQFLQFGGAGLLGLQLPTLLAAEEQTTASGRPLPSKRAKSVIFVFLFGGPSQLETFDMKPEAPDAIRGPFKPIACRTPGLLICEHLPNIAAHQRSHLRAANAHAPLQRPQLGRALHSNRPSLARAHRRRLQRHRKRLARHRLHRRIRRSTRAGGPQRPIPSYVYLPNRLGHLQTYSVRLDRPGQYAGWLGRGYDALATDIRKRDDNDNPFFRDCTDDELDFRIKGLAADAELTIDRLLHRRVVARRLRRGPASASIRDRRRQVTAISRTCHGPRLRRRRTRTALDIRREPAALRDRYGRHLFGQATLMARRMVEAGARFVTVAWDAPDGYSWDSHVHSDDVKQHLLPGFDQAFSALVTDLETRGLLDETLVVA